MASTLKRVGGCLAGFAIVIVGLSLFTPEAGLPQTARVTALISVLIALGIGVMAASLLPNSITVDGEKVKPLGVGLNATGGAAFFIVTLIFLFYTEEPGSAKPGPAPVATETAAPAPSDSPSATPSASPSATPAPTPAAEVTPPWGNGAPPPPVRDDIAPTSRITRVWTYCHECCPQGPENCPQIGWAEGTDANDVVERAVRMCIASGGKPQPCFDNVTAYDPQAAAN